ncbi:porphobilinogen synthase [bacterium]|nr:porphobilinogen synthase [bacterium]
MSEPLDLPVRLRRLRASAGIRAMLSETTVEPRHLIQPLFVTEGEQPEAIASLPGIFRIPLAQLAAKCAQLQLLGIHGVALFPKIEASRKTAEGAEAWNPNSLALRAIREVKFKCPGIVIFADIALDPYTTHGHDGILNGAGTDVDNDRTVEALVKMSLLTAQAGADFVAPSDMMDGRVAAIRQALDANGRTQTGILAYSAKFASAFYGPFRDAVGSTLSNGKTLSKATYQMNPANRREAIREALIDAAEGADLLMVKPAGSYLDIIRDVRESSALPIAAYQVSGEYAQLHAAAEKGWLQLRAVRDESLLAIRRAGADVILTYFAEAFAKDYHAR